MQQSDDMKVQTHGSWRQEKGLRILVSATLPLPGCLNVTSDNLVVIPDDIRSRAEFGLEAVANVISLVEHSKRSISSPTPCIALGPESTVDRDWLRERCGIELKRVATVGTRLALSLEEVQKLVVDRIDGVFLLAEAIAHEHATGKFHELNRFFERAFARSGTHLVRPLFKFLEPAGFGYSRQEVKEWVFVLRHGATHADRSVSFLLEADVRPVVGRMEQAAYDVLFNKEVWHGSSFDRRAGIRLTSGITSARSADMFLVRGAEFSARVQLLDPFGRYPLDLTGLATNLPDDWWCVDPRVVINESGGVGLSVTGGKLEVRDP